MEFEDIKGINELFRPLYPYIAKQVVQEYGRREGSALEVGPYAPGISVELIKLLPDLKIIVGDDSPQTNDYIKGYLAEAGLSDKIELREIDKFNLPFEEGSFDLVYFRGALFFWEEADRIVKEAHRVLKAGGLALLGGGFGAEAPDELINRIVEGSRELNRRLGKATLTSEMARRIVERTGLAEKAKLDQRHGLWIVVRK